MFLGVGKAKKSLWFDQRYYSQSGRSVGFFFLEIMGKTLSRNRSVINE